MKTYTISIDYETEIKAESPEEAEEQFFIDIEGEPQQTFDSWIQQNLRIKEKIKNGTILHKNKIWLRKKGKYI